VGGWKKRGKDDNAESTSGMEIIAQLIYWEEIKFNKVMS
jgi:hypothetical protein